MTTQIINNECWLSVNLNLLVKKRAEIMGIVLDEEQNDSLANEMRVRATLDFLFEEVDDLLLKWAGEDDRYGQISGIIPDLEYDKIVGNGWELEIPTIRKG